VSEHDEPPARDSYDIFAEQYARAIETKAHNACYERPGILAMLPDLAGKQVLDAGCGPGLHAAWMVEQGAQVTAVDVSAQMTAIVQRRLGERVVAHTADLGRPLSFLDDNTFDIVLSSLTLHYIHDLTVPMSEFGRILRPGGLLVFSTHHPVVEYYLRRPTNYFSTELVEEVWRIQGTPMPVKFYRRPLSAITAALSQAGFCIDTIAEPLPLPDCRETDPKAYQRLSTEPWFLFVRAQKK
jgi:SAM-dependent methyltransferase